MFAAIFDTVVANAEVSHGNCGWLIRRKHRSRYARDAKRTPVWGLGIANVQALCSGHGSRSARR